MPAGLTETSALRWTTLLLCVAAAYVCWPMWPGLVLAAWTASLVEPLMVRFERALHGRRSAAAVFVFLLFLGVAMPVVMTAMGIVIGARDLATALSQASSATGALQTIAVGSGVEPAPWMPRNIKDGLEMVQNYGAQGFDLLTNIAGAAAKGLVVVFIYFVASFAFILEGKSQWAWVRDHNPLCRHHFDRLTAAFHETGRGLLIGVGLTTATQGLAATVAYLALGVPQAWVLGPITGIASVIPLFGSSFVWGPVALGLLLTDQPVKAIVLTVIGLGVIGTIDNLLRPVFARMGALRMPMLVLFVSIFGGLVAFGTWGAVMGPLLVRLAMEALMLIREDHGPLGEPEPVPEATGGPLV